MSKTNQMTMAMFNDLRKVKDQILDVSTGGFLKSSTTAEEKVEEEKKNAA